MHVAAVTAIVHDLLPALARAAPDARRQVGGLRRHREDRPYPPAGRHAAHAGAGSSRAGWRSSIWPTQAIATGLAPLHELAIGGTAVGTGLNTHPQFGERVAAESGGRYRPAVSLRIEPLCGARRARRAGARPRGAEGAGGGADQDRQRRALAGVRPALRPGRAAPAGERTRQLDHARQGQPDPVRGAPHGCGPGDGQRRGRGDRRRFGPVRTEHRQAGDRPQLPAERAAAGRRDGELRRVLRAWHRTRPSAHRRRSCRNR